MTMAVINFCFTKALITPISSPVGIDFTPEAIIFSTNVEPHLGTPTIKMGFNILYVF